jgi:PAS domain S-box-containing protein
MPVPAASRLQRALVPLLFAFLALAASCRPSFALEKATLQLKWLHHYQFAGYYAAKEKGFYRAAGLDVAIREGGPYVEVEKEVSAGRADFGVGTSAILLHLAHGEKLVVLGQIFQHSPAIFLTPRKTGIRTIADMASRRFMYSNQHGDLMAVLKKYGLDERKIVQVPHRGDVADLLSGKADVMIAYSFNEPFVFEQAGEPYLRFSPLTEGVDFYGDNFFTTRNMVEHRPELVKAFREATLRGWSYAMTHKEEVADLIRAKYSKAKSREWLLYEANQMEALIQPTLVELGYQSPKRWQEIANILADLGMVRRGFDPTPVIYAPEPHRDYRALIGTAFVSSLIIVVLAGLLLVFRRLNHRLSAAHEELVRSAEQLRALFDSAQAGILMVDPEGKISVVNQRMTELFACPQEALVGAWYPDLLFPDQKEEGKDRMREILAGETDRVSTERHYIRKDGSDFWGYISVRRHHDSRGGVLGLVCHITDITELKRAEAERQLLDRQLLHAQKLESLGVLAGGIAHDFNNLLAGILGNISLARMFLDPSHKASTILTEAEKASRRASELALRLLTFAKGGEPIKKAVDAKRLVRESALLVLSGSNVRCEFRIPDDLRAIEADEGQIGQVFNNIVLNGAQAMPGGGTITISADTLAADGQGSPALPAGDYVRFRITDQGCGISPENLKRIFDPYFTTKAGGTGLGLASTWSIVGRHGGHLSVASEPGAGSTFEIVLPASDREPPAARTEMPLPRRSGPRGHSVLVIDDEAMIRTLVSDMLTELGYAVQACGVGNEAIALCKKALEAGNPYSAVIMDLTIPGGIGGKEAAKRILADDPDACLIVSSGYSNDPVMADYTKYGFRATMAKPYDMAQIEQVLSALIGGERPSGA